MPLHAEVAFIGSGLHAQGSHWPGLEATKIEIPQAEFELIRIVLIQGLAALLIEVS